MAQGVSTHILVAMATVVFQSFHGNSVNLYISLTIRPRDMIFGTQYLCHQRKLIGDFSCHGNSYRGHGVHIVSLGAFLYICDLCHLYHHRKRMVDLGCHGNSFRVH